jgi:hypothetical protein
MSDTVRRLDSFTGTVMSTASIVQLSAINHASTSISIICLLLSRRRHETLELEGVSSAEDSSILLGAKSKCQ